MISGSEKIHIFAHIFKASAGQTGPGGTIFRIGYDHGEIELFA